MIQKILFGFFDITGFLCEKERQLQYSYNLQFYLLSNSALTTS